MDCGGLGYVLYRMRDGESSISNQPVARWKGGRLKDVRGHHILNAKLIELCGFLGNELRNRPGNVVTGWW